MDWFCYDLIILIKKCENPYKNLDKPLLFSRNQVCLKKWKVWRAPTTTEFNIFWSKLRTRFLLTNVFKKTLWPLFMDGVQLPQGYRATTRRQFTFYHQVPRNPWRLFDQIRKDERLSQPWRDPMILNTGHLDWESSALTTRPLQLLQQVKSD